MERIKADIQIISQVTNKNSSLNSNNFIMQNIKIKLIRSKKLLQQVKIRMSITKRSKWKHLKRNSDE